MLTLSTSEDGGGGYDGCNRFTGSHEDGSLVARPDGTISFPGFGGTLAFCDHPRGTVPNRTATWRPWRTRNSTKSKAIACKSETGRETSAW